MTPTAPAPATPMRRANRHRMVFLTWPGIYPTITAVLSVLEDLQALPLPSQCKDCCSCCNGGKLRITKSKKQGPPKSGASSAPPIDTGGS